MPSLTGHQPFIIIGFSNSKKWCMHKHNLWVMKYLYVDLFIGKE
jgi:hypothetical protein